jgi:hypothetical protein
MAKSSVVRYSVSNNLLALYGFMMLILFFHTSSRPALAEDIYGCAKKNGNLRLVYGPGQCHDTEREVFWPDVTNYQQQIDALNSRVSTLEQLVGVINKPPMVNAGLDQRILLSWKANLNGTATDQDNLFEPLTSSWTQASGPGTASFADPAALNTAVSFDQVGEYTLRLTAFDGLSHASDEMKVTVYPDNDPPSVSLISPKGDIWNWVQQSDGRYKCEGVAQITVTDDGLPEPLVVHWSLGELPSQMVCGFNDPNPGSPVYIQSMTDDSSPITTVTTYQNCGAPNLAMFLLTYSVTDGFFNEVHQTQITCRFPY